MPKLTVQNERGHLWRKVITIKYDEAGFRWFPSVANGSYGHGILSYISKGWEKFSPYLSF